MAVSPDSRRNHLLAALPEAEGQRWLPQLEWVDMPLGQVRYESGNEGVTKGARKLQQAGLICYARGRISVLDRQGVEQRTCER